MLDVLIITVFFRIHLVLNLLLYPYFSVMDVSVITEFIRIHRVLILFLTPYFSVMDVIIITVFVRIYRVLNLFQTPYCSVFTVEYAEKIFSPYFKSPNTFEYGLDIQQEYRSVFLRIYSEIRTNSGFFMSVF